MSNAGDGTLSYAVSDDADWLSESPASGTGPGSVSVTASTVGLSAGTYAATITLDGGDADGPPVAIPVTLTVSAQACNRVASLAAAQSEIAAGRDACLADGIYGGPLTLSTSAGSGHAEAPSTRAGHSSPAWSPSTAIRRSTDST